MVGKLIVFEGQDGSGKTTQLSLLAKYLKKQKVPIFTFDFPQYWKTFHGRFIGRYLSGEFGDLDTVNPYLISLAYALDRATAKKEMSKYLRNGYTILADRYVASSLAHHSARLEIKNRTKFINWLKELEYKENKMPKEDVVIFLYIPVEISWRLLAGRERKKDIHEKNKTYQEEVEKVYLQFSRNNKNWLKITCVKNGQLRTKEDIHREIVKNLKKKKILST